MAGTLGAADIDPKPKILGTVLNLKAGVAIYEGDVVSFASTGTDYTVYPCDTDGSATVGGSGAPMGVALHAADAGAKVAVAGFGSVVKVKGAITGATAIEAGTYLQPGITAGGVIAADTANATGADSYVIGISLEAIDGVTSGYALINGPILLPKGA